MQVNELAMVGRAKEREMAETIHLRRDSGFSVAVAAVQAEAGKRTMGEFRRRMTSLVVRLNQRRSVWTNEEMTKYHDLLIIGRCTIALILLLVGVAIGFLTLSVRRLDELQRQREQEAMHDVLTGLPNRRYLREWLDIALAAAARNGQQLAVLYFDLDGFKAVNDQLGHAAGDRVLQAIAARLRNAVRASDFIARFGGDEFVAVLPDTGPPPTLSALVARLRETLAKAPIPELADGAVTASIGVAMYPRDGADAAELLTVADRAMYEVKETRRLGHLHVTPIAVGVLG